MATVKTKTKSGTTAALNFLQSGGIETVMMPNGTHHRAAAK